MAAVTGQALAPGVRVLRTVGLRSFPPGGTSPDWTAFEPSSEEKNDAKTNREPVRVSVWDRELTTVDQARGFRRTVPGQKIRVFELSVQDVLNVGQATGDTRMKVVRDPLPPANGPGAEGHCAVEGLDRLPGCDKASYKNRLQVLAERLVEIDG